jgi:hypothetical protein
MLTFPALSLKFVASGLSDWTIYYVSAEPIRHFKLWDVKGSLLARWRVLTARRSGDINVTHQALNSRCRPSNNPTPPFHSDSSIQSLVASLRCPYSNLMMRKAFQTNHKIFLPSDRVSLADAPYCIRIGTCDRWVKHNPWKQWKGMDERGKKGEA